jgi:DNA-binding beta-propeller fold protein YncE
MKKIAALFILFFSINIMPQIYTYVTSFGEFNDAVSIYINAAGIVYISDTGSDEIYKYDTLGTFIKEAGGFGWNDNSFDDPVDIFATPLNIFVSDKNNHRIQQYDKDLNYISRLITRESRNPDEVFGYPLSCAASSQGDLYILDSENNRIIKFDLFGNFIQNFGGYDAGEFSLEEPKKLAVSPVNLIYVLDKSRIIVFDQYGNGVSIIPLQEAFSSMNIIFNKLTASTDSGIYVSTLNSSDKEFKKVNIIYPTEKPEIRSGLLYNDKLYILTPEEIQVYTDTSQNTRE